MTPDSVTIAIVRAAFDLISANPAHLSREANALRRAVLAAHSAGDWRDLPREYRGGGRP
jgi:hypothetical protein